MTATKAPAGPAGDQTPAPPTIDVRWRDKAACAGMDPSLFVLDESPSIARAKRACRVCPVRKECLLAAALTRDKGVVRGGRELTKPQLICLTCHVLLERRRYKPTRYCSTPCRKAAVLEQQRRSQQRKRAEQGPRKDRRPTHCVSGRHEFTPENTAHDKRGQRICVACRRERARSHLEEVA